MPANINDAIRAIDESLGFANKDRRCCPARAEMRLLAKTWRKRIHLFRAHAFIPKQLFQRMRQLLLRQQHPFSHDAETLCLGKRCHTDTPAAPRK